MRDQHQRVNLSPFTRDSVHLVHAAFEHGSYSVLVAQVFIKTLFGPPQGEWFNHRSQCKETYVL
eukprot:gene9623-1845_t